LPEPFARTSGEEQTKPALRRCVIAAREEYDVKQPFSISSASGAPTVLQRIRSSVLAIASLALFVAGDSAQAQSEIKGQRIFSAGHSFHYFMPPILAEIAKSAKIDGHKQLGLSAIGGSRVYQHWNATGLSLTYYPGADTTASPLPGPPTKAGTYTVVAKEENKAKEALRSGKVDVFTMSPIYLPDDGIANFVKLGVENNPKIRIFVQENWLPWDHFDASFKAPKEKVDHNAPTAESLRKLHEPYFKSIDEHVMELNKKYDTNAVRVAPVGQAVILLRERILEGKAPGLKEQNDLFADAIGHARAPQEVLVAYVYYALIYERSPAGLPLPKSLGMATAEREKLNALLQEIAWQAVTSHPQSGVKVEEKR
jgi:hypothetical protein